MIIVVCLGMMLIGCCHVKKGGSIVKGDNLSENSNDDNPKNFTEIIGNWEMELENGVAVPSDDNVILVFLSDYSYTVYVRDCEFDSIYKENRCQIEKTPGTFSIDGNQVTMKKANSKMATFTASITDSKLTLQSFAEGNEGAIICKPYTGQVPPEADNNTGILH